MNKALLGAASRLLLVGVLLAGVAALGLFRTRLGTPITLAGGALLLCGIYAGKVASHAGLPRLTGYLLVGVLIGPYVFRFIPKEGVAGLDLVKGLAVSLIALTAGAELRLGLLRRVGTRVVALCTGVSVAVFVASVAALAAARPWLPFLAQLTWPQTLAVSAVLGAVIISFSPTVTIAIVQETGARGRFTEFLMSFVIIGDLVVLVAFAFSMGLAEASFGGSVDLGGIMGSILWELFGSIGVGALIGVAALFYVKRVGRELPLFLSGICFAAAQAGAHAHLSPLLMMLMTGAVIANLDEHTGERLHAATQQAGLPVFALFFAAVGAGLALEVLWTVGAAALAFTSLRAVVLYLSCRRLTRPEEADARRFLWMGLVSQAGVTFGLATIIASTFPGIGPQIEAFILAMVTINQLIGPVLVRRALVQVGEVPHPNAPSPAAPASG